MHMLWHYYIAVHAEFVLLSNAFQRGFQGAAGLWSSKVRPAFVTTESKEVKLAGLVESFQSPGHGDRIFPPLGSSL